jgi:hypothetical protein
MDDDRVLIGEFDKNTLETVRVSVTRFKGKIYVDARVYVRDDSASPPAETATKKGLCLSPELVLELIPLLSEAQERAAELTGGRG